MKKIMFILVLGALMACLVPAKAQSTQDWQTSTMQGSGSNYAPQVTEVGATSAASEATTTDTYSPGGPNRAGGPRRAFDTGAESGQSSEFPVGDAVLPMMLFALMFCGVIALRRKRVA